MDIGWKGGLAAVAVGLLAAAQPLHAQKPSHDEERARDRDICGYQLMTERERAEYRERARRASGEGLDQVVNEHRARMQARAKERGVVLSCDKSGPQIKGKGALTGSDDKGARPPVVASRGESESQGLDRYN